jgi:hypothetical protein
MEPGISLLSGQRAGVGRLPGLAPAAGDGARLQQVSGRDGGAGARRLLWPHQKF